QLGGSMIDLDHNGEQAGEIVYYEVSEDDQIKLVGVVENGDRLDDIDEPIYLSGMWEMRGGGEDNTYIAREAQLLAAALTLSPFPVPALPVRWLPADLRRKFDRFTWPGSWAYHMPLLGRAHAEIGDGYHAEKRTATYIVDQRERRAKLAEAKW